MLDFAEQPICRRRAVLRYFDEEYGPENCGTCDVCAHGVQTVDASVDAQKIMSAIYRTDQRFGAGHIVDIVYGAKTGRISALGHDQLKTYGVGRDKGKRFWRQLIDSMLSQGLLTSEGDPYPLLRITSAGEEVLFGREKFVTHRMLAEQGGKGGKSESLVYDERLFGVLKQLRRVMAEEAGVPPYILFSDKSLHQMSGLFPQTPNAMLAINGVGQMKLERYGQPFLAAIQSFLTDHPEVLTRQLELQEQQAQGAKASFPPRTRKQGSGATTLNATLQLAAEGLSIEEIATRRELKSSTIATHIGELLQQGQGLDVNQYVVPAIREEMTELFRKHGTSRLKPIVEAMEGRAGYDEAHIIRGFLIAQGWGEQEKSEAG
jgi:ATP-dependent DNA helicase RecQ